MLERDRFIIWKEWNGYELNEDEKDRLQWLMDRIDQEHTEFLMTGKVGWFIRNYSPHLLTTKCSSQKQ